MGIFNYIYFIKYLKFDLKSLTALASFFNNLLTAIKKLPQINEAVNYLNAVYISIPKDPVRN